MFHRGHFGLGWRHLGRMRHQATLSEGLIQSPVRHAIPDNFKELSETCQKSISSDFVYV